MERREEERKKNRRANELIRDVETWTVISSNHCAAVAAARVFFVIAHTFMLLPSRSRPLLFILRFWYTDDWVRRAPRRCSHTIRKTTNYRHQTSNCGIFDSFIFFFFCSSSCCTRRPSSSTSWDAPHYTISSSMLQRRCSFFLAFASILLSCLLFQAKGGEDASDRPDRRGSRWIRTAPARGKKIKYFFVFHTNEPSIK